MGWEDSAPHIQNKLGWEVHWCIAVAFIKVVMSSSGQYDGEPASAGIIHGVLMDKPIHGVIWLIATDVIVVRVVIMAIRRENTSLKETPVLSAIWYKAVSMDAMSRPVETEVTERVTRGSLCQLVANPIPRWGCNAHDRDLHGRTMSTCPVVIVASHHTEKRAKATVHDVFVGSAGGGDPMHKSVSKLEVGELA
jgi:hypothetical protein